ncbi:MAG TPA: hypothetical protein VG407_08420 [Caulobacteraceae bacterium]|jgi:hypothetical protein|nr:hypothetical protein [Caulobacteraceae bacterium]
MTATPRLFLAAALSAPLAAFTLVAAPAQAGIEHQPQSGTPAYEVDVPADWIVNRDESGNLYLLAPDHSGGVVLNVVAVDTTSLSLDDLAAQSMKVAGAPPASKQSADSIGGVGGTAYYSSIPEPDGAVSVKMVLAKLDAGHVASEGVIRNSAITPAQDDALNALVAKVHFIR